MEHKCHGEEAWSRSESHSGSSGSSKETQPDMSLCNSLDLFPCPKEKAGPSPIATTHLRMNPLFLIGLVVTVGLSLPWPRFNPLSGNWNSTSPVGCGSKKKKKKGSPHCLLTYDCTPQECGLQAGQDSLAGGWVRWKSKERKNRRRLALNLLAPRDLWTQRPLRSGEIRVKRALLLLRCLCSEAMLNTAETLMALYHCKPPL